MEVLVLFGMSLFVGLSGAITPGPLLMVNITEVARRGFWAGPGIALGHSLLELVTVILLAMGLSPLLRFGAVPGVIGLLGGLFLLRMGAGMVRSAPRLSLATNVTAFGAVSQRGPVFAGVAASITNPYWALWWATIGASFLTTSFTWGVAGVAAFYLGHIAADFTWYTVVAAIVATGRRYLTDGVYRALIFCCGLFLLATAVLFVTAGIGMLRGLDLS